MARSTDMCPLHTPRAEEPPIVTSLLSAASSLIVSHGPAIQSKFDRINSFVSDVRFPTTVVQTVVPEGTLEANAFDTSKFSRSTPPTSPTAGPSQDPPFSSSTLTQFNSTPCSQLTLSSATGTPITNTTNANPTSSESLPLLTSSSSLTPTNPTASPSPNTVGVQKSPNKTVPIVVGVVVPVVLIGLAAAGVVLYKRRRRARDRREWERTHEAIADAVRQVGGPASSAAALPAWSRRDGEATPLFEKSGGADFSSLGPKAGGDFLSHSPASIG
ncbi:hypothetical protein DFH06DRAFT_531820 [Mycena polygramma]|nr:hypothetical protein DFH06DRAFT_531820 [Mycena polygramma]